MTKQNLWIQIFMGHYSDNLQTLQGFPITTFFFLMSSLYPILPVGPALGIGSKINWTFGFLFLPGRVI